MVVSSIDKLQQQDDYRTHQCKSQSWGKDVHLTEKDMLESLEPGFEEEEHWLYVLEHQKLYTSPFPYEIGEVSRVDNPRLCSRYNAKRREFQKKKYPRDAETSFYGFAIESQDMLSDIIQHGPSLRKTTYHILGHNEMGFHLWRHSDVCMEHCRMQKSPGLHSMVIFKYMFGKKKSVIVEKCRTNGNMLLPTPGYDCHVSTVSPCPDQLSLQDNISHSQVYLYSLSAVKYKPCPPEHVYPVAVITLFNTSDMRLLELTERENVTDVENEGHWHSKEQEQGVLATGECFHFKKEDDFQIKKPVTHFLSTAIDKPIPSSFQGLMDSIRSKPLHARFTDLNNNDKDVTCGMVKLMDEIWELEPKVKFSSAGRGFTDKSSNLKWVTLKPVASKSAVEAAFSTPKDTSGRVSSVELRKDEVTHIGLEEGNVVSDIKLTKVPSVSSSATLYGMEVESDLPITDKSAPLDQNKNMSEDKSGNVTNSASNQAGHFDLSQYLPDLPHLHFSEPTSINSSDRSGTGSSQKPSEKDSERIHVANYHSNLPTVSPQCGTPCDFQIQQQHPSAVQTTTQIPVHITENAKAISPLMSLPEGSFSPIVFSSEANSSEPALSEDPPKKQFKCDKSELDYPQLDQKLSDATLPIPTDIAKPKGVNIDVSERAELQEAPSDVLEAINCVQLYINQLTSEAKMQYTDNIQDRGPDKKTVKPESGKVPSAGNKDNINIPNSEIVDETEGVVPSHPQNLDGSQKVLSHKDNKFVQKLISNSQVMNTPSDSSDISAVSKRSCTANSSKTFHGRTLLKGKQVPPRAIPLQGIYLKRPIKPSGKLEVVPQDPRINRTYRLLTFQELSLPLFAVKHNTPAFCTPDELKLETKMPNFLKQYKEITASVSKRTISGETLQKDMTEAWHNLRKQFQVFGSDTLTNAPSMGHDCDYRVLDMDCETNSSCTFSNRDLKTESKRLQKKPDDQGKVSNNLLGRSIEKEKVLNEDVINSQGNRCSNSPFTLQEEYDLLDETYNRKKKNLWFQDELKDKFSSDTNYGVECRRRETSFPEQSRAVVSSKKRTQEEVLKETLTSATKKSFSLSKPKTSQKDRYEKESKSQRKGRISPIVFDVPNSESENSDLKTHQLNTSESRHSTTSSHRSGLNAKAVYHRLGISPDDKEKHSYQEHSNKKHVHSRSTVGKSDARDHAKRHVDMQRQTEEQFSSNMAQKKKKHVDYSDRDYSDPRDRPRIDYSDIHYV